MSVGDRDVGDSLGSSEEKRLRAEVHGAIQKVTQDVFDSHSFNTAIAELMKLSKNLNGSEVDRKSKVWQHGVISLVQMLAPLAPYTSAEMWRQLEVVHCLSGNVHGQTWPSFDEVHTIGLGMRCSSTLTLTLTLIVGGPSLGGDNGGDTGYGEET